MAGAPAQAQAAQAAQARKPIANASKLGRADFEALSDDEVVEVKGKPMTKREVMKQVKALREAKEAKADDADDFDNERAAFAKKQKSSLDAENAAVLSKMSELRKAGGTPSEARKAGGGQQETLSVAPIGTTALLAAPAPAPAAATPVLSGFLGQLKPGSAVIFFGSNFGIGEGEVRMYGTFPNGYVKLPIDTWGSGGIGVFVPADIKGVLDQQVTIKIVTKAGAYSNYKTASFTAAREIRKLKMSDFTTKKVCVDAALSTDKCTTVGQSGCTSSVCGDHAVPVIGLAQSTDRWATTLKNGWTYDHHGFEGGTYFSPGPQEYLNPIVLLETYLLGNDKPTLRTVSTGATPSFEVPWGAPSLWADTYKLNVYVVGPAGTSHI